MRIVLNTKISVGFLGGSCREFGPEANFFPEKCVCKSWGVIASGSMTPTGKGSETKEPYKIYLPWHVIMSMNETY